MKAPRNLGDLQLAILRVLWDHGEATVADVHQQLRDRGLALTTIATMLRKMEDKGLLLHRENGRQFVYRTKLAPDQVERNLVGELVTKLFDGDPLQLVNHLLRAGDIDLHDLEQLKQQVAAAERQADKAQRAPKERA